jgi:hypothetical protein
MPEKILPMSQFKTINMPLMQLFEDCIDKNGKFYKIKI